jgi:hypothetical protein
MKKSSLILLLGVFAVMGYFGRPWVDQVIPGQAMAKEMPELDTIYEQSVMLENAIRNPVIVVPGMMGSKLRDRASDRTVWGVFDNQSIDVDNPDDIRLLACPIDGSHLDQFEDGVLDSVKVNVAGVELSQRAYLNILQMLGVGGYRDEELGLAGAIDYGNKHYTCFQFPYDWRRDNGYNAAKLHEFLKQKKAYIEAERKRRFGVDVPVRFDIVAHSMGGLITRYYLRYGDQGPPTAEKTPVLNWSGCEDIDQVILIGTPNNGSARSLVSTHEGFSFSIVLKTFPSGMVATLPSIYQLLPSGPEAFVYDQESGQPLNHYDVETWDQRGWGLLNPDQDSILEHLLPNVASYQERKEYAKAHVKECLERAYRFHKALNVPAAPPQGTGIHLFAGDAIATVDTLFSNLEQRTLTPRSEVPGDHTVTRKSALADQRTKSNWSPTLKSPIQFSDVRFLFDDHFGLTRDAEFSDNALYLLLEDPRKSSPAWLFESQ